jgi:hypothetical protein
MAAQLGKAPADGGSLIPLGLRDSREMDSFHRSREKERMNIPEEPEPISQLSQEQRVYIYNVSPWRFKQEMGSMGAFTIPALDDDKVLTQDLHVAGPLVVEGLPKEYYPSEGQAKVIYHRPTRNRGRQSQRPGLDFANEVIGRGMGVNPASDLTNYGVFVSEFPEPQKPTRDEYPNVAAFKEALVKFEASGEWKAWVALVHGAQQALRRKCAKMCEDANIEYARGRFGEVRNDQLYQAARLIGKTEVECKWLADTASAASNERCPGCGKTNPTGIIKCICGMRVCSDEQWAAVKDRYSNN